MRMPNASSTINASSMKGTLLASNPKWAVKSAEEDAEDAEEELEEEREEFVPLTELS